jgi:hypothetical protein
VYFEHEREPSTLPLVFGNAFHAFTEDTLVDKQLAGPGFTPAKARNRWEAVWHNQIWLAKESKAGLKIESTSPEVWFEQGLGCVELWITKWLPRIDVRDVEIDFLLGLKDIPRKIYGRLDYTENSGTLNDLKTSGRAYHSAVEEYKLQFSFYHLGYFSLYHSWPRLANVIRVETEKHPDIEPIDISLSREEVQEQFDTIIKPSMVEICAAWESGVFVCRCKRNHATINWADEMAKKEAEELAKDKILNPTKYAAENAEEMLKIAKEEQQERLKSRPNPDSIPF